MGIYTAEIALARIEELRVKKRVSTSKMLKDSNLSKSIIDNLKKGSMFSADKAAILADYLECSVDYLLGRTNIPNVSTNTISNRDTTISGTQANVINSLPLQDEMTAELVKAFQSMNFVDKMEIMNAVLEKTKK